MLAFVSRGCISRIAGLLVGVLGRFGDGVWCSIGEGKLIFGV